MSSLYIVCEGAVVLKRVFVDGREMILDVLGPGDCFGDVPLLDGGVASFCALAVRRTTLAVVRDTEFRKLLDDQEGCRFLIANLATRCNHAWAQIEALGCVRVEDRIRATLAWLSKRIGVRTLEGVEVDLNQTELAQLIGTTRETVNRSVQALKRKGILSPEKRSGCRDRFLILEPGLLAAS